VPIMSDDRPRKHRNNTYSAEQSEISDSSSSEEERRRKKKKKRKEERKRQRRRSHRSDDESDADSSSSRRKKRRKKEKKKMKKLSKEEPLEEKAESIQVTVTSTDPGASSIEKTSPKNTSKHSEQKHEKVEAPRQAKAQRMAPMSREQYEAQQSQIREVYDEESGRYRLVRGTGEIMERIVSRGAHAAINQSATRGDGSSFAKSVYNAARR
jgi:hypothetical protein